MRGRLPCKLRELSPTELAWLAGWMEGEACFYLQKNNGYVFPKISVISTDMDTLEHALAITGVGLITSRAPQKAHYQPQWAWQVTAFKDTTALMEALLPLMKSRRAARIREILSVTETATRASA